MPSVTFAKRDNTPAMPIREFLNGERFDPETTRILGIAFEAARIALRLADRGDAFAPIVAKRIIELAKTGEHNPDVLCERVLKEIRTGPADFALDEEQRTRLVIP
jgi:hypothetical protein